MKRFALSALFAAALVSANFVACNRDALQPEPPGPPSTGCVDSSDAAAPKGAKFCDLPGPDAPAVHVPAGFCVREFTSEPVVETRVMRFAPNGDLFLAVPAYSTPGGVGGGAGAILVLPDDNHDGKADGALRYAGAPGSSAGTSCGMQEQDAANLGCVHGLTFADGYLYYTRSDELRRFPYKTGDRISPTPSGQLVGNLGEKNIASARWTHGIDRAKDGSIYVARGRFDASCNGTSDTMTDGAVVSFAVGKATTFPMSPVMVADGFRDPLYVRCQPGCGDCFTNELTGDGWDGIGGREKLALLEPGAHWGYPCCVAAGMPTPGGTSDQCKSLGLDVTTVPLHDTPFGMDFEQGFFPAPYTFGFFVALHGSFGGWKGTAVSWVPTDGVTHRPKGALTQFATGWGHDGMINGRATDVAFSPDGRLFIGDDTSGRIFWVAPKTLRMP